MAETPASTPASTPETSPEQTLSYFDVSWWTSQPWVQHTIAALIATLVAYLVWRILHRGIGVLCRRTPWLIELELLINRTTRWIYWIAASLFIAQQAGMDTDNLWTAITAAVAMVAVGFVAVWSVLSNLIASILILANRLFSVGDEVELCEGIGGSSIKGTVKSIDLMFTVITEQKEDGSTAVMKIPNNLFFQKVMRVIEH